MNADPVSLPSASNRPVVSVADSASADPIIPDVTPAAQKDQYLRLAADFENFRKRTRRDSERQAAAEKEAFIRDLLPILDILERALASEQMHEGVEMVLEQLSQLLQHHGIQAVEDVGRPFDPHRQEAVVVRHDPLQPDHVVLAVNQRGYCRGDQVFRPAKVTVNDLAAVSGASDAC